MARTIVNTRKIEVIPSYARKNKSAHGLPRQVSWMTMHSFAQLGRVRHNKADGKGDTTVPTTKGREWMLC